MFLNYLVCFIQVCLGPNWCDFVWFGVICTLFGDNHMFWCDFDVNWSGIIWCGFIQVWLGRSEFGLVWFGVICTLLVIIYVFLF